MITMVRIVEADSTCTSTCSFEMKNLDRMTDFISDTESESTDWSSAQTGTGWHPTSIPMFERMDDYVVKIKVGLTSAT